MAGVMHMSDAVAARVLAIAIRAAPHGPMRETAQARATPGAGLEGHGRVSPRRGVTLLAIEDWRAATGELGVDLPWHTRRANVLVEGLRMPDLPGRTLRIGEVKLRVEGETEPCENMERAQRGLLAALTPGCRGGVHCRVLTGGVFCVGDAVEVIAEEA
jgi:MOSC domain-containing protein YiiM